MCMKFYALVAIDYQKLNKKCKKVLIDKIDQKIIEFHVHVLIVLIRKNCEKMNL